MATAAASMASGSGEGKGDIPSVVLLELWGHVADDDDDDDDHRPDATTATSTTSTGLTISPSRTSPSTALVWRIWTPNPSDKFVAPTVVSADADLLLLRVPVDRLARFHHCFSDYFVYKAHPHSEGARLYRLPSRPSDRGFGDDNIAILSCGNDSSSSSSYAVAVLQPWYHVDFRLHLCRSTSDGKPGSSWISHQLTVEEPLMRRTVCPVPDSALRRIFHTTTKVITLGGAKGTVGWVDLWRGILLCDVLEDSPKLRDMPLPLPARVNWPLFLNRCPYYCRDIVVSQSRDTIKYVEMEFTNGWPPSDFEARI
ncbi:hypothetical protein EE612_030994 [Oryza sativa]|nr:hypothetical protein EE612_030994 [Oryza sativa]